MIGVGAIMRDRRTLVVDEKTHELVRALAHASGQSLSATATQLILAGAEVAKGTPVFNLDLPEPKKRTRFPTSTVRNDYGKHWED